MAKYSKETEEYLEKEFYPILKIKTPLKLIKEHSDLIKEAQQIIPNIETEQKLIYWLKNQRKVCYVGKIAQEPKIIKQRILKVKDETKEIKQLKISKKELKEELKNEITLTQKGNDLKTKINAINKILIENRGLTNEQEQELDGLNKELEENEQELLKLRDKIKNDFITNRSQSFKNNILYHVYKEVEELDSLKSKIVEARREALHYLDYYKSDKEKKIAESFDSMMKDYEMGSIPMSRAESLMELYKTQMDLLLKESVIKRNKTEQYFRAVDSNRKAENQLLSKIKEISEIFNNFKEDKQQKDISEGVKDVNEELPENVVNIVRKFTDLEKDESLISDFEEYKKGGNPVDCPK